MFDRTQFSRKADIRGVYPNELNEELAYLTGRYLVRYLAQETKQKQPKVLLGRDGRVSSPAIYRAVLEGLSAEGGVPLACGLATTDMIQWGAGMQLQGAVAGVMITASHNPGEYNGIKMLVRNPATNGLDIVRPVDHLKPFFEADGDGAEAPPTSRLPYPTGGRFNLHRDFVAAAVERAKYLPKATGKVVIDPGNGVGSVFLPLLKEAFQKIGAKVELLSIFDQIDGRFPNRPSNPGLPGAVKELQETVVRTGAKFGAAFDGDADRVFLVNEKGEFVPGSQMLAALAAKGLKQAGGKGAVVFAAVSSYGVIDAIRKGGGTPIFCRVGQDAAKVALIKTKAVFGGESSAHYNFPDVYCLDSGLFALMMFWDLLLESGSSCSQALAPYAAWPHSGEVNLRIQCGDWRAMSSQIIKMLEDRFSSPAENCYVNQLDGISVYHPKSPALKTTDDLLTIDQSGDPSGKIYRVVAKDYRPEWWFNVRASNNEPLLRINYECQDPSHLQSKSKSLIDAVHAYGVKHGAQVEVESPGNLTITLS
jgi:phosphomannomutase